MYVCIHIWLNYFCHEFVKWYFRQNYRFNNSLCVQNFVGRRAGHAAFLFRAPNEIGAGRQGQWWLVPRGAKMRWGKSPRRPNFVSAFERSISSRHCVFYGRHCFFFFNIKIHWTLLLGVFCIILLPASGIRNPGWYIRDVIICEVYRSHPWHYGYPPSGLRVPDSVH